MFGFSGWLKSCLLDEQDAVNRPRLKIIKRALAPLTRLPKLRYWYPMEIKIDNYVLYRDKRYMRIAPSVLARQFKDLLLYTDFVAPKYLFQAVR